MLLPLLVFAIWIALVVTPAVLVFIQSHETSIGPKDSLNADYTFDIRRDDLLSIPMTEIMVSRAHTIGTVSLPATVVETLISAPSIRPSSWHSADFTLDYLRALAYPLYCLPVWWFVGAGVDALLGRRHIGSAAKLTGTALTLLFTLIFLGFRSGFKQPDPNGDVNWIFRAVGLWILMFAVLPAVWLKQGIVEWLATDD
jgi:hypothetical protein